MVNISSIKDTGETIRVKTIKPQIVDPGNTSIFHIGGALSIEKEKFNKPSQHPLLGFHSDDKWTCIRNLKLDDVNPSKATLETGGDPEAFIQRDIKKGGDGQHLLIKTLFAWANFGNNRNAELDVQSKVAVNTALTKDAEMQ